MGTGTADFLLLSLRSSVSVLGMGFWEVMAIIVVLELAGISYWARQIWVLLSIRHEDQQDDHDAPL